MAYNCLSWVFGVPFFFGGGANLKMLRHLWANVWTTFLCMLKLSIMRKYSHKPYSPGWPAVSKFLKKNTSNSLTYLNARLNKTKWSIQNYWYFLWENPWPLTTLPSYTNNLIFHSILICVKDFFIQPVYCFLLWVKCFKDMVLTAFCYLAIS